MHIHWLATMTLVLLLAPVNDTHGSEVPGAEYSTDLVYAQVMHVEAVQDGDDSWCIKTTVRHHDEGWDHYADAWQVLDEEGNELGKRVLAHPHDDEQPFARSQCDIRIPEKISRIIIRARCNLHGYGGRPVIVDLYSENGERYKVTRSKD